MGRLLSFPNALWAFIDARFSRSVRDTMLFSFVPPRHQIIRAGFLSPPPGKSRLMGQVDELTCGKINRMAAMEN
ncbi:MAG TPA: hypothetical protein ENK06_09420 [Gammaproteobacteria bacterium]|nr:hypothetical protein [Gammaproteobacteria bacterium]